MNIGYLIARTLKHTVAVVGTGIGLRMHLDIVHHEYPWANHMPLVAVIITVGACALLEIAQDCFRE